MWFLGVETRNKCLYVVSDQLGALQSLKSQSNGFQEQRVLITSLLHDLFLFFKLQTVALVICLYFGHWA